MASTVLLVALWGRAVVVDTDQLANSLSPLAGTDAVVDRFASWLVDELIEEGLDPVTAEGAAEHVLDDPAVSRALEGLLGEMVHAAASPGPGGSTVDARSVISPAVPDIAVRLNELGVPVSEGQLAAAVTDLDPLVVRRPSTDAYVGPDSAAASKLGTAVILALTVIVITTWIYTAASKDRTKALRSLFTRFSLGALSFAVFLRIGGWVLDPGGGRAPVSETLGLLAVSKWLIPLGLGLAAAVGAGVFWVFRRRQIRPGAESRSRPGVSILPPG
ncbi:MAG: hypothetical protein WED83_07950 [Acidimicrobiia bacterium]